MGHAVFFVLHVAALLLGAWLLLVTLPLHLLYSVLRETRRPAADAPSPRTHRRCPDCRELVRADASVCRHCSAPLVPQHGEPTRAERRYSDAGGFVLAVRRQGEATSASPADRP